MATIQTGSIVNDLRGKVGNEVYCRNKSGPFVRTLISPVQPDTSFQMDRRANMATVTANWQALTDEVRMRWNVLAAGMWSGNRLGVKRKISGFQLFKSRHLALLTAAVATVPVARNDVEHISFNFDIITASETSIVLEVFPVPTSSNMRVYWYMSPAQSAGVMSANTPRYTFVQQTLLSSAGLTSNLISSYTPRFGALTGLAGDKLFVKAKVLAFQFPGSISGLERRAGVFVGAPIIKSAVISP